MFAVIETGGKQYKVAPNQVIRVERLPGDPGAVHQFTRILYLQDSEGNIHVGQPTVENAHVVGQIVQEGKGKKVVIFKFRRRKDSRRKTGHRQIFTELVIRSIGLGEATDEMIQSFEAQADEVIEVYTAPEEELYDDEDLEEGEEFEDDDIEETDDLDDDGDDEEDDDEEFEDDESDADSDEEDFDEDEDLDEDDEDLDDDDDDETKN